MTAFKNMTCVSKDGSEAPMYLSGNENIFTSTNKLACRAQNAKIVEIRWNYLGVEKSATFDLISSAVLDKESDLLIVVVPFANKQYPRPENAVVINPDGTINHRIAPPKFVFLPDASNPVERHAVEAIYEVVEKNERTVIGLNYRYDKIERRYYEPSSQRWLERDLLYRQ